MQLSSAVEIFLWCTAMRLTVAMLRTLNRLTVSKWYYELVSAVSFTDRTKYYIHQVIFQGITADNIFRYVSSNLSAFFIPRNPNCDSRIFFTKRLELCYFGLKHFIVYYKQMNQIRSFIFSA